MMVPPTAIFLFVGIWMFRKRYGGVRHVISILAIAIGLLLAAITIVVLPD